MAPPESQRTRVPRFAVPGGNWAGAFEDLDVVRGGVGSGVARTQQAGERLAAARLKAEQGGSRSPPLAECQCALLLRVAP